MKKKKGLLLAILLLLAIPVPAHAGWFSWLFTLFRAESRAVISAETRSVGTTFARAEARSAQVAVRSGVRTLVNMRPAALAPVMRSSGGRMVSPFVSMSPVSAPASQIARARPQQILTGSAGTVRLATKADAAALVPKNGGSRATLRSPKFKMEVDLTGSKHAGIATPHTKISPRNTGAPASLPPKFNTSRSVATYRATTQQDLRTVRRSLERRK